jgi:hypothetical protein
LARRIDAVFETGEAFIRRFELEALADFNRYRPRILLREDRVYTIDGGEPGHGRWHDP